MTKSGPSFKVLYLTTLLLLYTQGCSLTNPLATATETPVPKPTSTPQQPVLPISVTDELINLSEPPSGSRLISPIVISGNSGPTFEQTLVISLTGQDGSQIALQSTTIQADAGEAGPFMLSLPFSINVETAARLSVYDVSARDGGIVHLNSVVLTLLPSGASEIAISSRLSKEAIHITRPLPMEEFSGGLLLVSGFAEYFFEGTLHFAICGAGGSGPAHLICGSEDNLLVESFTTITSPDVGLAGPFSAQIEYSVAAATRARMVVYALSPMDGAIEHLASQEIVLNP